MVTLSNCLLLEPTSTLSTSVWSPHAFNTTLTSWVQTGLCDISDFVVLSVSPVWTMATLVFQAVLRIQKLLWLEILLQLCHQTNIQM